jgi:hypothetical protein
LRQRLPIPAEVEKPTLGPREVVKLELFIHIPLRFLLSWHITEIHRHIKVESHHSISELTDASDRVSCFAPLLEIFQRGRGIRQRKSVFFEKGAHVI